MIISFQEFFPIFIFPFFLITTSSQAQAELKGLNRMESEINILISSLLEYYLLKRSLKKYLWVFDRMLRF